MRMSKEQLEEIKEAYGVDTLWSFSRLNSFDTSHYEWFLRYIKHEPEDRADSIYGVCGTLAHDTLERYYSNEISYADMINKWDEGFSVATDICDLKFNRNDPEKNQSLSDNYNKNLRHFFQNHDHMGDNLVLEDYALINIDGNIINGYIDAYYKNPDGTIVIIDFKTSSKFQKDDLIHKSRQLILYAMSFMQQNGVPLDKIQIGFNFLKYADITYQMKNGKYKTSTVERRQLAEKLQTPCKTWLKAGGYDVDEYLMKLIDSDGDLSVMPDDVQEKISVTDSYLFVPLTQEIIDDTKQWVLETIEDITNMINVYEMLDDESVWYDSDESVEKESYYFACLCGYSANKHIPYKRYLERLEKQKNGEIW